jgi:hypothetical protein
MNGEYHVEKEDWAGMTTDGKLWMIYNTFNQHRNDCDKRFCKLEKRQMVNTLSATGAGLIGGFLAMIGKGRLW